MKCCKCNIPSEPKCTTNEELESLVLKVYRYAKQLGELIENFEIDIDDELSETSENPVQNKVIAKVIKNIFNRLDNCENGGSLVIDEVLTADGINPVQGKAIYNALQELKTKFENKLAELVVDDALSETSENPVQNKVVTLALNALKNNVAEGKKIKVLTIYKSSSTMPSTPSGGSYNFETNTFSPPYGWSVEVEEENANNIWISIGIAEEGKEISWGNPFKPGSSSNGEVSSDSPVKVRIPIIYRKSDTEPDTPVGGVYNFTTEDFTVPNGWTKDKSSFVEGDVVWMSIGNVTSDDDTITWSDPIRISGGTGSSIIKRAKVLSVYKNSDINPGTPVGGTYNFEDKSFTPPEGWDTEDNYPEGSVVWMSIGSINEGDSEIAWNPPIRVSGGAGSSIIKRVSVISIYKASPTTPENPSGGSYDFTNKVVTPPTGWQTDENSFEDGDIVWMSIGTIIEGDSDINWSKPLRITPGVGSANITTAFVAVVYKSNPNIAPEIPTGGNYNFETKELTPPEGWQINALSGNDAWFSCRVFYKNGTVTNWSEPKPATSADVTLTAANLAVIAQNVKLTTNELDIIAGKIQLNAEELNTIAKNVVLTTDNLVTIADNIDISTIDYSLLAKNITLTSAELAVVAQNVELTANDINAIANKVTLNVQQLETVAENVVLTTDNLITIADNVNISAIDYSILASRITLTTIELNTIASKVNLTTNQLSIIAEKVTLDAQDLQIVSEKLTASSDFINLVADNLTLTSAQLNAIAENISLTSAQLDIVANKVVLRTEDLNTIATKVTLSTDQLNTVAGKVNLTVDQLNTIASKVNLTSAEINTIASKVTLNTEQLKVIANNVNVEISDSRIETVIENSSGLNSSIEQIVEGKLSSIKLTADNIDFTSADIKFYNSNRSKGVRIKDGSIYNINASGVATNAWGFYDDGSAYIGGNKLVLGNNNDLSLGGWIIDVDKIQGTGTNGVTVTLAKAGDIHAVDNNTPSTPSGGSYDFDSDFFIAPNGWSKNKHFSNYADGYISIGAYIANGSSIWSTPFKAGVPTGYCYIYGTSSSTPSGGSFNPNSGFTAPTGWSTSSSSSGYISVGVGVGTSVKWSTPIAINGKDKSELIREQTIYKYKRCFILGSDGSASFSRGKILFSANGEVSVEGIIKADAGYIGNFNISNGNLITNKATNITFNNRNGNSFIIDGINKDNAWLQITANNKSSVSIENTGAKTALYVGSYNQTGLAIKSLGSCELIGGTIRLGGDARNLAAIISGNVVASGFCFGRRVIISSNYTVTGYEDIIHVSGSSSVTITLPTTCILGKTIMIVSPSANVTVVSPSSSYPIYKKDGTTTSLNIGKIPGFFVWTGIYWVDYHDTW